MKTSDLSIKELAAFMGVSTDTIRRAVRRGEVQATRVGTALRFDLHEVRTCRTECGGQSGDGGPSERVVHRCKAKTSGGSAKPMDDSLGTRC